MFIYLIVDNECIMKYQCRNSGKMFACKKPKKNSKFITCYNYMPL
jgi:hypothetical protein